MNRTIVFGDIHGGFRALDQLLNRIDLQPTDRLVFLGDYVDGWSESAQVIDCLMELDAEHNCAFIRGNHDVFCQHWLETGKEVADWKMHGGGPPTTNSYSKHSESQRKTHLEFFQRMRDFYIDDANRLFVHAGFTSLKGVHNEHHVSNFQWDRSLLETALLLSKSALYETSPYFPKRLLHYFEIYIGHTPTTNFGFDKPMQLERLCNMDTGAAFWGRISAMEINTKHLWQSDPVFKLYPEEAGRN